MILRFQQCNAVYDLYNCIELQFDIFPDTYAAVSCGAYSQLTAVVRRSPTPMWDQTLVFDEILLYEPDDAIAQQPPDITVEIFNQNVSTGFLSRPLCALMHSYQSCIEI